jgi:hypothetical protein
MKFRTFRAAATGGLALAAAVLLLSPAASATAASPSAPAASAIAIPIPGESQPASADTVSEAQECAQYAAKAGFSFNNYIETNSGEDLPVIVLAVAIGLAESSCSPSASPPGYPYVIGLWQINTDAHPSVSEACAEQPQCNADAAFEISDEGYDWCAWATYGTTPSDCTLPSYNYTEFVSLAEQGVYGYTINLDNQGTGTCLDADSTSVGDGGKIFQWDCNSSDKYQQWVVEGSVGDLPILKNVGTGTCLDADSTSVGDGGKIFQWDCNQSDTYQQWWFYGSGNLNSSGDADAGVHSQGTGTTCLDADSTSVGDGGTIFQWDCNQSDTYQEWN